MPALTRNSVSVDDNDDDDDDDDDDNDDDFIYHCKKCKAFI